jgi:hypothetical protein
MFDPYKEWLGISKEQRPVDYFQLLGLDPKEKDPQAIRAAAQRRVDQLSDHKEGAHAQTCTRLLKQIRQAQTILLAPAQRKAYETQLRKIAAEKTGSGAEEEEGTALVEKAASDSSKRVARKRPKKGMGKSTKKSSSSRESGRTWLWLTWGGVAALVLVGGIVTFWLTRSKKDNAPASPQPVANLTQQSVVIPPAARPPEPTPLPPVPAPEPKPTISVAPAPPPSGPLSRPAVRKPRPKVVKLAVPDQAAQDKAEKAIKETYPIDYAKKKPEDYLALAAKLLQPGRENRADPAAWFVLLREARDVSVRAKRPRLAVEAVNEIDKWFLIDAFAMKLQYLNTIAESDDKESLYAVAKTALFQIEEAVAADNYDAALRLADAAESAARKGKFDKQLTTIETKRREVKEFQEAYRIVAAAQEKLRNKPDDPDANLTVGRHLCFFHERWDEGLPLLTKGGLDEAVTLARKDLTPPADEKAQIAVGDGWWLLGNRAKEWDKRSLHNRAVAWYELVQPTTTGEEKTTMMKRMEEAFAVAPRITRLLPGSFYGRGVEDRILLLREGGGTMQSEEAVALGLQWLAQHQSVSGGWSNHAFHESGKCTCSEPGQLFDVAGTAFGLLPFLGAGETPTRGRYARTVRNGLGFLLAQQKPEGKFSDNMYENALATLVVCETYGITKDKRYLLPAQLAVHFIVQAQHPEGSWGYTPGAKGDTSITGWQFSALKAGYYAGLSVPSTTFARVGGFLDEVADPSGLGYGYNVPGAGRATTAAGLMCREYLGWHPSHPALVKAMTPLLQPQNFVTKDRPSIYFLFYATQIMHHAGGDAWDVWNPKTRDLLIEMQDQGKEPGREHQKGSFSPRGDDFAVQGGRLMFTSLALLLLEVYYYNIPVYGYGPTVLQD